MKLAIKKTTAVLLACLLVSVMTVAWYRNLAIEELTPWCVPYCPPEKPFLIDSSFPFHEGPPTLSRTLSGENYTRWKAAEKRANQYIAYSNYAGGAAIVFWLLTYVTEHRERILSYLKRRK